MRNHNSSDSKTKAVTIVIHKSSSHLHKIITLMKTAIIQATAIIIQISIANS